MKLSVRSIYGVRLMLGLAQNYDTEPVQLSSISKSKKISEKYLSQIVIPLRLNGLILSTRGSKGGYSLSKQPKEITVKDIIECLEGDLNIVDTVKDNSSLKYVWQELNKSVVDVLSKFTLQDLINKELQEKSNFIYYI